MTSTARYGSCWTKASSRNSSLTKPSKKEERVKQATAITKNGLPVRPGGFAEIDFFGDNNRSFEKIIGNRPVLRSNTIMIDVRAPERNGVKI